MADEKQAAAAQGGAPQPGDAVTKPDDSGTWKINKFKFIFLLVTVSVFAGMVYASSTFTQSVVVPQASVWLAEKRLAEAEATVGTVGVPPIGTIHVIEDLVINPAGSAGMRYVCVSVGLESANPAVLEQMQLRDPQIKDRLIRIFGSKTVPELVDVTSREKIRAEIRTSVEEILPPEGLDAVYFVNFVLQ
ncbi:MAG: flagellar basal body-associated FliL family protein [Candidatus Eisenbacteria bacterium]|nr:flagellar basal body-associated FliL family protein [Candidatus Eisenbacteria bacterium]